MNQTRYFASRLDTLSGPKIRGARTETPEFDLAWMNAYVVNRRLRGVNPHGTRMEGEEGTYGKTVQTARRELGALVDLGEIADIPGVRLCKRGHEQIPENQYHYRTLDGYNGTSCKLCRNIRAREQRQAKIAAGIQISKNLPTHCKYGHEFTPENTMPNGVSQNGNPRRKCRTCNGKPRQPSRRQPSRYPAVRILKTHCKNGHEFTPENTGQNKGGRYCRECGHINQRRYYANKKGQAAK